MCEAQENSGSENSDADQASQTEGGLLIMAAGLGTRFRQEQEGPVKQLTPVSASGHCLLEYALYDALMAGFSHIVLVIRRELEGELGAILDHAAPHCETGFAYQDDLETLPAKARTLFEQGLRTKPLGTAHAVFCAKAALEAMPFATLNADDFYGRRSLKTVRQALLSGRDPNEYELVGYPLEQTLSPHGPVSRGVLRTNDRSELEGLEITPEARRLEDGTIGYLPRGSKERELEVVDGSLLASMNLWGFRSAVFDQLEAALERFSDQLEHAAEAAPATLNSLEKGLPQAVLEANEGGKNIIHVREAPDRWLGMTHPQDLQWVRQGVSDLIQAGEYPDPLWS